MNRATVIFGLILFCSGTAFAAGPARIDGSWYYLNDAGEKTVNAFVALDGVSYYFGEDGALQSDCVVEHEGRRYGLAENGALLRNQWRRFFSAEKDRFCWMYFGFDGRAFENGWLAENGDRYHFTDGIMDYGWYTEEDGSVFYLGGPDEGKAQKGWFVWKGGDVPGAEAHTPGWYYFSESTGKMMSDMELEIGGAVYAFNKEGTEVSGFCTVTENGSVTEKYYDPASGKRAAGWFYIEAENETAVHREGWYFFIDGIPLRPGYRTVALSDTAGTAVIDSSCYAFDAGGRMITGHVQGSDGKDYFFASDGKMLTGTV